METPREFLEAVAERIEGHRTQVRRAAGQINVHEEKSLLMQNYFFPSSDLRYSVELKPKWGLEGTESRSCRFCRHQRLQSERPSQYCPADLFSSDKRRIERAVLALIETPCNNLRVFLDGKPCSADAMAEVFDVFVRVLDESLVLQMVAEAQMFLAKSYFDKDSLPSPLPDIKALFQDWIAGQPNADLWIVDLLTSVTIQDCSMIVLFSPSHRQPPCIKLVDLDIKLPDKLAYYLAESDCRHHRHP